MSRLADIQRDIAASLRDPDSSAQAARWLTGRAADAERRLAIYRANAAASVAAALSGAYPVLRQVVGDGFFAGLARGYQRDAPSTSGDLTDYGEHFAALIDGFPYARSLPYLADLARLEWAVHRAHGAEDAAPWDRAALASVAPKHESAIRFAWAAGTNVIVSEFPVARIWTVHQPGHEGEFAVASSLTERALIAREGLRVTVSAIGMGDAAFIASSLNGATLGEAVAAGPDAASDFDLTALLARAMAANVICGFNIDPVA